MAASARALVDAVNAAHGAANEKRNALLRAWWEQGKTCPSCDRTLEWTWQAVDRTLDGVLKSPFPERAVWTCQCPLGKRGLSRRGVENELLRRMNLLDVIEASGKKPELLFDTDEARRAFLGL